MSLTEQKSQEIVRFVEANRPLPERYRMEAPQMNLQAWEDRWTGDYIFENEWQSFRTKKKRSLELKSIFHECEPRRRKIAVKVVDIFGNDTMTIVDVSVGNNGGKK